MEMIKANRIRGLDKNRKWYGSDKLISYSIWCIPYKLLYNIVFLSYIWSWPNNIMIWYKLYENRQKCTYGVIAYNFVIIILAYLYPIRLSIKLRQTFCNKARRSSSF